MAGTKLRITRGGKTNTSTPVAQKNVLLRTAHCTVWDVHSNVNYSDYIATHSKCQFSVECRIFLVSHLVTCKISCHKHTVHLCAVAYTIALRP